MTYKFKSGDKVRCLSQPFYRGYDIPLNKVFYVAWLHPEYKYAIVDEDKECVHLGIPEELLESANEPNTRVY